MLPSSPFLLPKRSIYIANLVFLYGIRAMIALAFLMAGSRAAPLTPPDATPTQTRWTQFADTVFEHYTINNGLPQSDVIEIAEDRNGFLWLGTEGGLSRFDGYRFRTYVYGKDAPFSLPNNYVVALHTDRQGILWIGTLSGGLARYDQKNDRFIRIPVGPHGLSSNTIRWIADDNADGLWIAAGDSVDHLNPNTGIVDHFGHDDHDAGSLPAIRVNAVLQDRHGMLWVATAKGLLRRVRGTKHFDQVSLPGLSVAWVNCLHESRDGHLWIGTKTGIYVLDTQTGTVVPVSGSDSMTSRLDINAFKIAEKDSGEIWVGSRLDGGILVVDPVTLRTRQVLHDPALPSSLATNDVWVVFWDRAGLLWAGTSNGLERHNPQQGVLTFHGASNRANGGIRSNVSSIMPSADGRIWLGFIGGNAIDIIEPTTGRIASLPIESTRGGESKNSRVDALVTAPSGEVYIGTTRGLFRADASGKHATRVDLQIDGEVEVKCLYVGDNRLWIGTKGDGLLELDLGSAIPSVVRAKGGNKLSAQSVVTIGAGPDETLWIGTDEGLDRYDPTTARVEHVVQSPTNQNVPTGLIGSVLTDRQGRLWVASLGGEGGIFILESRNAAGAPLFRRLGLADGLPSINVDKLLMDFAGSIWARTDAGVAVIDPNTFAIRALGPGEDVAITNTWSGYAVTSEGELLFGGSGGLIVLRKELMKEWAYRPPVVVTGVRIGGKPISAERLNNEGSNQLAEPLVIPPDANSLAVEFSSLDYSAPELNKYAYWLEGYDKAWIDTDATRRLASYVNLPPGDYNLRLRGSNRKGTWTERNLMLPIRVEPAWYQTLWFRCVEVIALYLLIALSHRLWARRLIRQRTMQEEKIKQHTALIEQKNATIEKKINELEVACRTLEELSVVDSLTGLRNRRYLLRNIEADISLCLRRYEHWAKQSTAPRPTETDLVFMMIDIDHFRSVNDTYGRAAGDMVLLQLSERLKEVARESDYMVRWGGEEFLMVARMTNRDTAETIAERVRAAISSCDFAVTDNVCIHKTCSIGFACFPYLPEQPNLLTWSEVVDIADHALNMAKNGGRNAWFGLYGTAKASPTHDILQRITGQTEQAVLAGEAKLVASVAERTDSVAIKLSLLN